MPKTIREPAERLAMDSTFHNPGYVLKTLFEIYAKQNGLRLEYTLDEENKTFTYALYDKAGNLVPAKY